MGLDDPKRQLRLMRGSRVGAMLVVSRWIRTVKPMWQGYGCSHMNPGLNVFRRRSLVAKPGRAHNGGFN